MAVDIENGKSKSMPRVAILPWPGLENFYLCLSGASSPRYLAQGWFTENPKHNEKPFTKTKHGLYREIDSEARISFVYEKDGIAAEWDGECGPITLWKKFKEKDETHEFDKPHPHWLWNFATGRGNWSQLAVTENNLPKAFINGDYEHIFNVLKEWVDARCTGILHSVMTALSEKTDGQ